MSPSHGLPPATSIEALLEHAAWLRGLAASLVAGEAAANDLTQDVWLVALRRPPRPGPLRPWLARVARRLAANFRRGEARRTLWEASGKEPRAAIDPQALAEEVEAQRVLAEALARLDEDLQGCVVLRYLHGLDSRAIAAHLGIPAGTVRWRLKRALELLREDLDRRYGERGRWCVLFAPLLRDLPSPLSTTAAASAATGALLMSLPGKILLTTVVLLAVSAGAWLRRDHASERAVAGREVPPSAVLVAAEEPAAALESAPERRESALAVMAAEPVPAECCIVGLVRDGDGKPLAGARVAAVPSAADFALLARELERPAGPETRAEADGSYSLAVPLGRGFVVEASRSGFATSRSELRFAGERADLVLHGGASLAVRVTSGAPSVATPGIEVRARLSDPARVTVWEGSAVSDAAGRVEFRALPAGSVFVAARGLRESAATRADSDGRTRVEVELALVPAGRVEGIVRDRESGEALAGARVFHSDDSTLTDRTGRYALEGISLGTAFWNLAVSAGGHASGFAHVMLTPEEPAQRIDFALDPAGRASGVVLDPAGHPVAGARVAWIAEIDMGPFVADIDRGRTVTASDGRFELAELRPGTAYRLVVTSAPWAPGLFVVPPIAEGAEHDLGALTLAAGAALTGRVETEADGSFRVALYRLDGESVLVSSGRQLSHVETTRADGERRFAFEELCAGEYALVLERSDSGDKGSFEPVPGAERIARLEAGRHAEVVLDLGGPRVAGIVVAEDGEPLSGIRVRLLTEDGGDGEPAWASTDRDGRFEFVPQLAGPFELRVEDRTLRHESRTIQSVASGEDELVIRLGAFVSEFAIHGTLVDDAFPFPEGVYVALRDATTGERLARVAIPEPDGTFVMRNLQDVTYELELFDPGTLFLPVKRAGVRPGDEVVLELERSR